VTFAGSFNRSGQCVDVPDIVVAWIVAIEQVEKLDDGVKDQLS